MATAFVLTIEGLNRIMQLRVGPCDLVDLGWMGVVGCLTSA